MFSNPVDQEFGEGIERMTCFFLGYLGPRVGKHGAQGDLMDGNWSHLKVCLLICLMPG